MTSPGATQDAARYDLSRGVHLEERIDATDHEALRFRWEFGRWMLSFVPEGKKKLPDGFLPALIEATGKSKAELANRRQFAEEFDEDALSKSLDNGLSWFELSNHLLGDRSDVAGPQPITWETPQDLFRALDEEFGFELDAAALEDPLRQPWRGSCWLDGSPAGAGLEQWVAKAHRDAEKPRTTIVCLLPARTDADWWWDYCLDAEIRFLRGRLHFGAAAVVIFGRRPQVRWWGLRVEPVRAGTRADQPATGVAS